MKKTEPKNTPKGETNNIPTLVAGLVAPFVERIKTTGVLEKLDKVIGAGIDKLRTACGKTELGKAQFRIQVAQLRRRILANKIDGKAISRQRVSDAFRKFGIEARKSSKKKAPIFSDEQVNAGSNAIFAFSWVSQETDPLEQAKLAVAFAGAVLKQCKALSKNIEEARKDASATK